MLLAEILKFIFDNPLGKLAALVLGLLSMVGLYSWHERGVGAADLRAEIERQTNDTVRKAKKVRSLSERSDAGGMLDPHASTH